MKPNLQPDSGDPLRTVLKEWVVEASLRPRFQEQVWNRIARGEAKRKSSIWGLVRLVEVALPRPKVALSYLAVLLALGIAAGTVTAQIRNSRFDARLSARYVQSVDPYLADNSAP